MSSIRRCNMISSGALRKLTLLRTRTDVALALGVFGDVSGTRSALGCRRRAFGEFALCILARCGIGSSTDEQRRRGDQGK